MSGIKVTSDKAVPQFSLCDPDQLAVQVITATRGAGEGPDAGRRQKQVHAALLVCRRLIIRRSALNKGIRARVIACIVFIEMSVKFDCSF